MTAAPPVPHPGPDTSIHGGSHSYLPNGLSRYHPIAMNPNLPPHQPVPHPDQMMHNHQFRHFPPPLHDPHAHPGPPGAPAPSPNSLEQIELRLRQLEHEEVNRMAVRSHLLAVRKREDEEFRRMTESAEAEEEDLRRQRKRLKRESMGLGPNSQVDSPPLRPTPPRRLSETSAATTLAFFKQQSPPEPRQTPLPPVSQAPPPPPSSMAPPVHLHPQPHHVPAPPPSQHPIAPHEPTNGTGTIRRKQKYTIKNVEAWGERHGRPASHDPSGRALWKRPSDGNLVYLSCPIQGCAKSDFVTLHGFMCHLTKKHKDRTLGSQSRALEICGLVYDPNAPLPPPSASNRASAEGSPLDSAVEQERDGEVDSDDERDDEDLESYRATLENGERSVSDADESRRRGSDTSTPPKPQPHPTVNGATKQSISSIIDRSPGSEPREALASIPPSESMAPGHADQSIPAKRKYEYSSPVAEKENTEPRKRATATAE